MANIPAKAVQRLTAALKRFQPIISSARARDVNESDTVTIVADMLSEMFGYDKYSEVTSEEAIRGTYCDLAVRVAEKALFIVEVKAVGLDLKDSADHARVLPSGYTAIEEYCNEQAQQLIAETPSKAM